MTKTVEFPLAAVSGLVLACLSSASLTAQEPDEKLILAERLTVSSQALGEDRTAWVALPDSYYSQTLSYPVIIVLDGNYHLKHAAGLTAFLAANNRMPEVIVVALLNTDRSRDMTPEVHSAEPPSWSNGGADRLLQFLSQELIPAVEQRYRTVPHRVLVGHSLAGMLTVYSLVTRPGLFYAHVAVSPSLGWDDQALLPRVSRFQRDSTSAGILFLAMGDEPASIRDATRTLVDTLEAQSGGNGLEWTFRYYPAEDHNSVVHPALSDGLQWLYRRWMPDDWEQLADQGTRAIDEYYAGLGRRLGYPLMTPEPIMNRAGYHLLSRDKTEEAIAAFRLNTARYPKSANAWDSLADGLAQAGHYREARDSYLRAYRRGREIGDLNADVYREGYRRMLRELGETPDD